MKTLHDKVALALMLVATSPAAFAAGQEEALVAITEVIAAIFALFVLIVVLGEYFGKPHEADHSEPAHER